MFSMVESYPSKCGILYALSGYIASREITVPFGSEHCALLVRGREE